MRTVADVSTDDLVNSLLNSVTSGSSSTSTSASSNSKEGASSSSHASESKSHDSASDSSVSSATRSPTTTSPAKVTSSPATAGSSASASAASTPETATDGTSSGDSSGGGAALSIGIAIGVLALVVATLLFLRARRRRQQKEQEPDMSPPAGATCLAVPADRGFKKEQELGMPEMSIELAPNELGTSKGLDLSHASSARSSAASNPYASSFASSTDSSVFNTQGGVSPTFSSRKMASYSYQYRASEEAGSGNPSMSSARSTGSKTFHLSGMVGNGTASGRGAASRAPGARKLSAPDEYAELVTATNAHGEVHMDEHSSSPQGVQADFTQGAASRNSAEPGGENQSFLAPLPTRKAPTPAPELARQAPTMVRASEESMGPDSPEAGRPKRTGSVYDSIPNLSGEKMSAASRSSEEDPNAMSTASFLTESSVSSASSRGSSARGSGYVASTPMLQQLSSAEDSEYGEDLSSERSSSASTDSSNPRAGSLIAMNLEAKDGCNEIAI